MLPVRFKPFIGDDYLTQDFKILVLGESHYLNSKDLIDYHANRQHIEQLTNNVINGYFEYKKTGVFFERWMNTFTKFGNIFNGRKLSKEETIEFWQKCSFYNYVQAPTNGPRKSPTKKEFDWSLLAFENTIELLKPDLVVVWGYRLWHYLPRKQYEIKIIDGTKIHVCNYGYNLTMMRLPHPSSSKFNFKLTDYIDKYLKTIKK